MDPFPILGQNVLEIRGPFTCHCCGGKYAHGFAYNDRDWCGECFDKKLKEFDK